MNTISLREQLNRLDTLTEGKYDLRGMYECCILTKEEKKTLMEMALTSNGAKKAFDFLNEKMDKGLDKIDFYDVDFDEEETEEESEKEEKNPLEGIRSNVLEVNGTPFYITYENGLLIANSAANAGVWGEYSFEYDWDETLDSNLEKMKNIIEEGESETLREDTVKQNGKWVNKGKEGTHGKFKTKKAADAQRKAMFANGYKENLSEEKDSSVFIVIYHIDDGDGRWVEVEARDAEEAASFVMEELKKRYPNAYYIVVNVGNDVQLEYGDYYYDDSSEYKKESSNNINEERLDVSKYRKYFDIKKEGEALPIKYENGRQCVVGDCVYDIVKDDYYDIGGYDSVLHNVLLIKNSNKNDYYTYGTTTVLPKQRFKIQHTNTIKESYKNPMSNEQRQRLDGCDKIRFYETESGKCPTKDFLDSIENRNLKEKTICNIEKLNEESTSSIPPLTKHIDSGIFELRSKGDDGITRVIFFFHNRGIIIMTNGYIKKTDGIDKGALELSKKYRNDYLNRIS